MKRFWKVFTVLFFVYLIINFGVALFAWVLCPILPRQSLPNDSFVPYRFTLQTWFESGHTYTDQDASYYSDRMTLIGYSQVVAVQSSKTPNQETCWNALRTIECGWPYRSLYGWRWIRCAPESAILGKPDVESYIVVPWVPIWGGWIRNFILLVLMPILFIELPIFCDDVRRLILARRQRLKGCCPECSYDLRGDLDFGCPECGWGRGEA